MSHEAPPQRPPLAPPFSRPTHPGYLPAVLPGSDAAHPLRPTPYASALIPALPAAAISAVDEADGKATQGATGGAARTLREVAGDHAHPGGVPVSSEVVIPEVDSATDYPTDSLWLPERGTGWTSSTAWGGVGTPAPAQAGAQQVAEIGPEAAVDTEQADVARGVAETLETLAASIRDGELLLPSMNWPQTPPAVLAAVLAALLTRRSGNGFEGVGEALEVPAGEPTQ